MFIVIYQAKGALRCETRFFGPFTWIEDAEDCLGNLPPAIDCEVKYIEELEMPRNAKIVLVTGANLN